MICCHINNVNYERGIHYQFGVKYVLSFYHAKSLRAIAYFKKNMVIHLYHLKLFKTLHLYPGDLKTYLHRNKV